MNIQDGNISFAYNPHQGKIYMVIFKGENGPIIDTMTFDENRWEKIMDSIRKANFQAEHSNWGKCKVVVEAEKTLRNVQVDLEAKEKEG